jgi:signal transduction histidine kinase
MTMMGWKSLRWRLPLSYAIIALVTTLVLAAMLLLALHRYYLEQERRYLLNNASTIGLALQLADRYDLPAETLQAQVETFSFFTRSRVRLLDVQGNTVADSGSPVEQLALSVRYAEQDGETRPVPAPHPVPRPPAAAGPAGTLVEEESGLIFWLLGNFSSSQDVPLPGPAPDEQILSIPVTGSFYGFDLGETDASALRRSAETLIVPIPDESGAVLGYVELSEGPAYSWVIVNRVARGLLIAASTAIVLAAGIGWLISRRISTPLVVLAETTLRMMAGDLSARAEVDRGDEIGVLAQAFNKLAAQVEETINTLRAFVSDAAHALHTPLTALHTDLELAAIDPDSVQRAAHLERALEQLRRFEGLTANLLDLSRLDAGIYEERRPVDVSIVLAGLSEVYASRAEQADLTLRLDLPDAPLFVLGHDVTLQQAVGNLLDNAIKFTPSGGQVTLSLYQADPWVVISVQDTGIGIPNEDLPHLFQRFHRGRNAASYSGSGLGLAITQSIIQAHGGTIEVQSSGEGTCFRVFLKWIE